MQFSFDLFLAPPVSTELVIQNPGSVKGYWIRPRGTRDEDIAAVWRLENRCAPEACGLGDQGWTWQAAVGAVVLGFCVLLWLFSLYPDQETQ